MSVTSFSGLRPGGESLVSGTSYSSLKKTHLLSSTSTSSSNSRAPSSSNEMAGRSGSHLKVSHGHGHTGNVTTPPTSGGTAAESRSSSGGGGGATNANANSTLPVIKVTSAPPVNGGGGNNGNLTAGGAGSEVSSTTTPPVSSSTMLPKAYGKIVLTLENVLLPNEKMSPTPSLLDGLDEESEMDLRIMGCELITTAGILLKVPQTAMATGQVLFQRFYYSKSFIRQPMEPTAMACIYLASKIEEAPRRIRDVVNVFHHIKLVRAGKPIQPMILDTTYIRLKSDVTLAERRVLKELGFCVHVKHPHKLIVIYLQQLTYDNDSEFVQLSWNYMSDALRSNVFVRYTPEAIACACIYLSARRLKVPLPSSPPWFVAFDATEAQLIDICENILALYERPKVNYELLEKKLEQLIKVYQDSKQKTKSAASASLTVEKDRAALDTPTSASPHSRPVSPQGNVSNAPSSTTTGSVINNGKEKGVEESKDRRRDESGKGSGKRSAVNSPEPVKRSRRTPSPIAYDDSPKRHKSKKRKKASSRYGRSYSSSRSRSRSRERKSSKKRSRRSGRSRSRSYTPPPPKRHHHHKHKSHRR